MRRVASLYLPSLAVDRLRRVEDVPHYVHAIGTEQVQPLLYQPFVAAAVVPVKVLAELAEAEPR